MITHVRIENFCSLKDTVDKGGEDKIVYRGVFSNIMSKLLEKINDGSLSGEPNLFIFQRQFWEDISQEMLNWGCTRNKEALS